MTTETTDRTECKLKAKQCEKAARGAILKDGGNLYLVCSPTTDRKVFIYYFRFDGKDKEITLGQFGYGDGFITLEDARKERNLRRDQVKAGLNPINERRVAKLTNVDNQSETFQKYADQWLVAYRKRKLSPTRIAMVASDINNHINPLIGQFPIRDIKPAQLQTLLMRWADSPLTAQRRRQTISNIFISAAIPLDMSNNPAFAVKGILKPEPSDPHPWLYMKDVPDFLASLDATEKMPQDIIGTKILFLTLVRADNLASACWSEFDLKAGYWYIPGPKMKRTVPHIVPLSRQVLALLEELRALNPPDCPVLFPFVRPACAKHDGPRAGDSRGRALLPQPTRNHAVFWKVVLRTPLGIAEKIVPHGFRHTASTFLHGVQLNGVQKYPDIAIAIQLAHAKPGVISKIELIYNHNKYMEQRTEMMQHYSDAVLPPTKSRTRTRPATAQSASNVVQLRRAA